ncbi:MAG: response regulator [Cyanobacteria bacterium SID2]|nr:response regulator [Cyanobacteria bacterium SID2]MBP0005633.1 response regulator [Cyanobacteria bacterium SBC]
MHLLTWRRWPIAAKIALTIALSTVVGVTTVTWLSLRRKRQIYHAELQERVMVVLDVVSLLASEALPQGNVDRVEQLMTWLETKGTIVSGRIYNTDGSVLIDLDSSTRVPETSTPPDPFGAELLGSGTVVFQWSDDRLLAGQAIQAGPQTVGAVSLEVPIASLDAHVAEVRNRSIVVSLVVVAGGVASALWMSRSLSRPLRQLAEASKLVAEGEFEQARALGELANFDRDRQDELGILARAFDRMTTQIRDMVSYLEQRAEQVQKSELKNQALLEAIPDIMFRLRTDGTYLDVQADKDQPLLMSRSGFLGKSLYEVLPQDLAQIHMHYAEQTRSTGDVQVFEYQLQIPDRKTGNPKLHDFEARMATSGADEVLAIVRDITERKRYEATIEAERQQLRQIVMQAPVAMAMVDVDMFYLAHSNTWLSDYNLGSRSLVGRCHYDVFPDVPERWKTLYEQALQGEASSNPEDMWERADGSILHLRWAIHPWYRTDSSIGGIVIASIAIDELVEAREAALETARLKSEFLANMSHEIRTPMNGVLGMTDLLLKTPLNAQQLEFTQALKTSGEHLLNLINDILDFSKLEADKLQLDRHPFVLQTCVEDVVNLFAVQAKRKGLAVGFEIDRDIPNELLGDSRRLRQVLINLVGNAIKFTDSGSISLSVTEAAPPLARSTLVLQFSVRDTGIGISETDREFLFQAFSQVDATSTRKYGGTGLGLAICQQLVHKMGGRIWVESKLDRGSTFSFTAQFALDEATDNGERTATIDVPNVAPPAELAAGSKTLMPVPSDVDVRGGTVLVVEDTRINQKVVMNQLKLLGFQAECVSNGREALDRLAQKTFDIILMDCQMPVLDGYQATHELRQLEVDRDRHTTVVGLTAHAMPGDRQKCLEAGMDDYLAKPVTMEKLKSVLKHWMSQAAVDRASDEGTVSPETPSAESESIVDWERLHEVSGEDPEFELELLDSFVESTREYLHEASQALESLDAPTFCHYVHQIKGASGNVGVPSMMHLASELNERAKQNSLEGADDGLRQLATFLDRVERAKEQLRTS